MELRPIQRLERHIALTAAFLALLFFTAVFSGGIGGPLMLVPVVIYIYGMFALRVQSLVAAVCISAFFTVLFPLILIGMLSGMGHRSEAHQPPNVFLQLKELPLAIYSVPIAICTYAGLAFFMRSKRSHSKHP